MSLKALRQYLELLKNCGIKEIYRSEDHEGFSKQGLLAELAGKYSTCTLCKLHTGRINFVYGDGNPDADIMVIGEGPGEQENLQGKPFVGRAGQLLTDMLKAINISRPDVYIANIVKCRPPGNRNPEAEERLACLPYLVEQIEIVQPRIFLLMGLVAAQTLLDSKESMGTMREQNHELFGRPAYVTYHPAALLRNENWKRPAWDDLKRFRDHYQQLHQ
ncbi:MAG: uracil-DNA glycosylase [Candidatus Cloacimonadaceae bacterium]|nr:uracil-DNA glycosylase [Candidatus Cloacimonadaceae bacterium]